MCSPKERRCYLLVQRNLLGTAPPLSRDSQSGRPSRSGYSRCRPRHRCEGIGSLLNRPSWQCNLPDTQTRTPYNRNISLCLRPRSFDHAQSSPQVDKPDSFLNSEIAMLSLPKSILRLKQAAGSSSRSTSLSVKVSLFRSRLDASVRGQCRLLGETRKHKERCVDDGGEELSHETSPYRPTWRFLTARGTQQDPRRRRIRQQNPCPMRCNGPSAASGRLASPFSLFIREQTRAGKDYRPSDNTEYSRSLRDSPFPLAMQLQRSTSIKSVGFDEQRHIPAGKVTALARALSCREGIEPYRGKPLSVASDSRGCHPRQNWSHS